MKLQYAGNLDFIFYGKALNLDLQIIDPIIRVKVSQKLKLATFLHILQRTVVSKKSSFLFCFTIELILCCQNLDFNWPKFIPF